MTVQITVRLPDDLVGFLDGLVRTGSAPSRAAAVTRALRHERRRLVAEQDARILAAVPDGDDPDDLLALARYAGRTPLDIA